MSLYHIYAITNIINNKIYIGKTNNLKRRWGEHCFKFEKTMPISRAIKKYGINNFNIEKLFSVESEDKAYECESAAIFMAKILKIELYNIANGGNGNSAGRILSEETKLLMSKSKSGKNNPNYGKNFYDRTGLSVSDSSKEKIGKITKSIAFKIREDYKTGNFSQKELGVKYNLSLMQINRIINYKVWK